MASEIVDPTGWPLSLHPLQCRAPERNLRITSRCSLCRESNPQPYIRGSHPAMRWPVRVYERTSLILLHVYSCRLSCKLNSIHYTREMKNIRCYGCINFENGRWITLGVTDVSTSRYTPWSSWTWTYNIISIRFTLYYKPIISASCFVAILLPLKAQPWVYGKQWIESLK